MQADKSVYLVLFRFHVWRSGPMGSPRRQSWWHRFAPCWKKVKRTLTCLFCEWGDVLRYVGIALLIGLSSCIPALLVNYQREAALEAKLMRTWSPWHERNPAGSSLDDELDNPRILLWSAPNYRWEGKEPLPAEGELVMQHCPRRSARGSCFVTKDRDYLWKSDAVVIEADSANLPDFPVHRHRGQVWVFWARGDPPSQASHGLQHIRTQFNWTMSYRRDADVTTSFKRWTRLRAPYSGETFKRLFDIKSSTSIGSSTPTSPGVWLLSECEEERIREGKATKIPTTLEWMLSQLVVGGSGTRIVKKCGREICKTRAECLKLLRTQYFYIVVAENSSCFEHPHQMILDALEHDIIPVYFGSSSLGDIAPPMSFVDTTTFPNVEAILHALLGIFTRFDKFREYMTWKKEYEIVAPKNHLCALCDALYEQRGSTSNGDVLKWWRSRSECNKRDYEQFSVAGAG
ncbi:alpha-(1,3)-fucosyltransferase C-like isoform X2 [Haemaphysalis longicornis]